jgi:hypothetical protein
MNGAFIQVPENSVNESNVSKLSLLIKPSIACGTRVPNPILQPNAIFETQTVKTQNSLKI